MRHSTSEPRRNLIEHLAIIGAVLALVIVLLTGLFLYTSYPFILIGAIVLLLGAGVARAYVGVLAYYNRHARLDIVRADKVIEMKRAETQVAPLASSFTYHNAPRIEGVEQAAPSIPEPLPPTLPGPLDLATMDVRPSESRILLAVDEAGAVNVSVTQLCHVGLLGSTGAGKSNLIRLIVPQLMAFGAQVCLADPHFAPIDPENGDDWRLIEQRLHFAPAVKPAQIDQVLDFMTEELDRRLERRRNNERVGVPMFLCFDELPSIADLVPDAVPRIGRLLREGRKVHLLTIGASQSMLVKEVGGSSALRDSYRTAAYCGGDKKSAAAILDIPERLIDDGPLGKGIVLLRSAATSPARLVRVPLVSNAAIASLLGAPAPERLDESSTFNRPSMGFHVPPKVEPPKVDRKSTESQESRSGSGESQSGDPLRKARILALFRQGKTIAEIVKELTGATSGGKYNQARAEVEEMIRLALEQGA